MTYTERLDGRTRIALAIAMPLGPACVAALRGVMPTFSSDSAAQTATAVLDAPARQSAAVWLGYAALLLLAPGVLAVARLTRSAAPALTWWAVALLVPAYLSLAAVVSEDANLWAGQDAGFSTHTIAQLYDHQHPALIVGTTVFVVGHVLGTVLLGIALLRSRRVAAPFAWALTVSQPLHFLAFLVLGVQALDVTAWGLATIGMGAAAIALLRSGSTAAAALPSVPRPADAPVLS